MRKITVLIEKTQNKVEFESNAVTLGDLKNELRERQVSFSDDDVFRESRSKCTYNSNESILPTNIPWKGDVTNDLVFMITAAHKKISSGASMDRKEIYKNIKELNLQEIIQKKEKKNYTQCATALLAKYVKNALNKKTAPAKKEPAPCKSENKAKETTESTSALSNLKNLLDTMVSKNILSRKNADNIFNVANGNKADAIEEPATYDQLAAEFKGWK